MRFVLLSLFLGLFLSLTPVLAASRAEPPPARVEVLVVGSEPEGVMAAVAAAESGAYTMLLTRDARLGGLFVLGGLNSLDLRTEPLVQRGLFERWWTRVGRGAAFDTRQAEAAFGEMLREAGVGVRLKAGALEPILSGTEVVGVRSGNEVIHAEQIIDATADGDLAAAAGVRHSVGFASLGLNARMADTLVFRLGGVDWAALVKAVRTRGPEYAQVSGSAAWGTFGGYPAAYSATEPGIRLRGLNLGRQEDGSVLVNALLVYGVDPFSTASLADGMARAQREAPRIIRYLRALPGLEHATLSGTAERLYLRDTRHFETRCTLTVDDTLDNVVREDDVAAGNYPLDVQTLTPDDDGYVYGVPELYGARLCVALPQTLQNLWIVGKTAGFDPLAASSTRVVPFGMVLAEAVGVAAAQASLTNIPTGAYAENGSAVQAVRAAIVRRGAYLPEAQVRNPTGPLSHPHFEAYRTLRRKGLALGGYSNDPQLDAAMPARGFLYLLANVGRRFWHDETLGKTLSSAFPNLEDPLMSEQARALTEHASALLGAGLDLPNLPTGSLTRGEAYALAAVLAAAADPHPEANP